MGLLLLGADGGTYALTDGTGVSGEPVNYDQVGVMLKKDADTYLPRISWGKFTDEALRQLRDDTKNPQSRAIVEQMIFDDIRSEKTVLPKITIQKPVLSAPASGHLGVAAIFSSPLGWGMLLILYGANLFAAYEVAVFRNQPVPTVCGLAAIPLFGVASPIFFLALPTRPPLAADSFGGAPVQASYTPPPLPAAAPAASEGFETFADRGRAGQSAVEDTSSELDLPAPVVYRRGDFSFNRRFFETKLAGFFRVVLSEADKDMLIRIKAVRGDFVGRRITRITPAELYLQVFQDSATADEMIPFVEIQEVEIRHKDLP